MPINVNDPEYVSAEKDYYEADSLEDKIIALKKMISHAPSHKGGENLRAQLKTRLKKLQEQIIKNKKAGKSSKVGIKKEDMQAVIVGKTNSGKSSIVNLLTNANPQISEVEFTTRQPLIGMVNLEGINMQLIENPAIESNYYDKGLTNSADTLLLIVNNLEQIEELKKKTSQSNAKKIIIFSKTDKLTENEKRKLSATLKSKKYNFVLFSAKAKEGIEELKNKLFESFDKIRIYTKEPGKTKSPKPIIMKQDSTVFDVAEKILKGFSKTVKETKIWGPSSKFPGQTIGLKHKLKDLDVVEFRTR
jgi:ribosome-interacting GTPase 1